MSRISHSWLGLSLPQKATSICSYNFRFGVSHERQREETMNRFNFISVHPTGICNSLRNITDVISQDRSEI